MASGGPTQSVIYVSSYFRVKCDGKTIDTVVTSQGAIIERWVNEILLAHATDSKVMVGLDIEWFYGTNPRLDYSNKIAATMQVCIDNKCLIIQLYHMKEIPQSFKDFLMNPKFTFMGVDADISRLVSQRGLDFAITADYRTATINKWPRRFKQHDLEYLAKQIAEFDMKLPDYNSLKKWDLAVLHNNQVEYACINAYASYKIAKIILAEK